MKLYLQIFRLRSIIDRFDGDSHGRKRRIDFTVIRFEIEAILTVEIGIGRVVQMGG